MKSTSDRQIDSWEYKLALRPELMSDLDSTQISEFLSRIFVPGVIRHHMKVKPVSQPAATICTVLFYDTPAPDFSYYGHLSSQGSEGGFVVRWREFSPQPPGRTDVTLKLRSPDPLKVIDQKIESSLPPCDDIKLKLELSADAGSPAPSPSYSLDNEIKSNADNCRFPSGPPRDASGWAKLFPILGLAGVNGSVVEVNRILVSQTRLQLVELEFEGLRGSTEGDLIVWENFNFQQNGFGQYLAAEFSFTVNLTQLKTGIKPPEACSQFLQNLGQKAADHSWLAGGIKTHTVFYPPAGD